MTYGIELWFILLLTWRSIHHYWDILEADGKLHMQLIESIDIIGLKTSEIEHYSINDGPEILEAEMFEDLAADLQNLVIGPASW